MSAERIMAVDAGTTNSTCTVFGSGGEIYGFGQRRLTQHYPKPGWAEQDPMEIWETVREAMRDAAEDAKVSPGDITALGISNQRETAVVWDRRSGHPVYNAIVWQCRRTSEFCDELRTQHGDMIREKTGLKADAYFSATKLKWILDNVPDARKRGERGELLFGTVDSWLIWKLTGGKVHATDPSNASRTMLFNINTMSWDREIMDLLKIPESMMPEVRESSGDYGTVSSFEDRIPITGVMGDQQAAMFGQACFSEGDAKCTYGTGGFLLTNIGGKPALSRNGLLTTVAWSIGGKTSYALEGSIYSAGAAAEWIKDMGIVGTLAQTDDLAESVPDAGGCYFVPAFTGLGAPYWDQHARGTIVGLTRGTTRPQVVRATLESAAYQVDAVMEAVKEDSGAAVGMLKIDGGMSANNFVAQFQADISDVKVIRPRNTETTSLGTAYMAGLAAGVWKNTEEIAGIWKEERTFEPSMDGERRRSLKSGWERAVRCARAWSESG